MSTWNRSGFFERITYSFTRVRPISVHQIRVRDVQLRGQWVY